MADEIAEEARREAERAPDNRPNPHLLAYDFFKHMTTLSVVTLGGVLTLSGSLFAGDIDRAQLLFSMGLIAAAGVIAFAGQIEMVDWTYRGTPRPRITARWGRGLVAATYGGGVGAFLSIIDSATR
jgi:hypothetical protein